MNPSPAPRSARPLPSSRLFGLALGCALASCAALAAWAATAGAPGPGPLPALAMAMGPSPLPRGPLLDHLLDDVKATPTQRAQVHQILDAVDADLRADRAAGDADRDRMLQLLTQPVVDEAAVEGVRVRMEQRHDAESRRVVQALVDLGPVLGADQRRQIAKQLARPGARPFPGVRPDLPAAHE
jgi:protein CpxP